VVIGDVEVRVGCLPQLPIYERAELQQSDWVVEHCDCYSFDQVNEMYLVLGWKRNLAVPNAKGTSY
jgi:hypothetical protein